MTTRSKPDINSLEPDYNLPEGRLEGLLQQQLDGLREQYATQFEHAQILKQIGMPEEAKNYVDQLKRSSKLISGYEKRIEELKGLSDNVTE